MAPSQHGPPVAANGAEAPMRRYVFEVPPCPKPRMTKRDQWRTDPNHPDPRKRQRPGVTRWFMFQNRLLGLSERERFRVPDAGLALEFEIPMPPSWTKKKRAAMDGQPHQQVPDIDNYVKAFLDALMVDDATVWRLESIEKRWAESGRIVATIHAARAA